MPQVKKGCSNGSMGLATLLGIGFLLIALTTGVLVINNRGITLNPNKMADTVYPAECTGTCYHANSCSSLGRESANGECTKEDYVCCGNVATPTPSPSPTPVPTNCAGTNESCTNKTCCNSSDICQLTPYGKYCMSQGKECSSGETKCVKEGLASFVYNCGSGGYWEKGARCDAGCSGNSCAKACTPGTVRCDGDELETCNSSGTAWTGKSCTYGCGTVNGKASCKTASTSTASIYNTPNCAFPGSCAVPSEEYIAGTTACANDPNSTECKEWNKQLLTEAAIVGSTLLLAPLAVPEIAASAFAYGTAALTTLPASIQTAIAVTGTVAGYAGVGAGTYACATSPSSEACLAYVAGIQGDPTALIQLANSADDLITASKNYQSTSKSVATIKKYLASRPPETTSSILKDTTKIIDQPKFNRSVNTVVYDPRLNFTVDDIRANLGDPQGYAGGMGIDDISRAVYDRNQKIYRVQPNTDPWAIVGKTGERTGLLMDDVAKSSGLDILMGDLFGTTPYCVGNVCYENAIITQAVGATYGQSSRIISVGPSSGGPGHAVVKWYSKDMGKLMISDPTYGATWFANEWMSTAGNIYEISDPIIVGNELIFAPIK